MTNHSGHPSPPPPPKNPGAPKAPTSTNAAAAPANASLLSPTGDTAPTASMRPMNEPSGAGPNPVPPEISAPADDFWDWIEDLLWKMILGVLKFVFVRVPEEMWRAIVRWFPRAVQVTRVLLLFVSLLVLTFGPASFAWKVPVDWPWPPIDRIPWYVHTLIVVWTVLAPVGAYWGIHHIKIRWRRRKNARSVDTSAGVRR